MQIKMQMKFTSQIVPFLMHFTESEAKSGENVEATSSVPLSDYA